MSKWIAKIARKDSDKDAIAGRVATSATAITEVLDGLSAAKADEKYGCAKVLALISEAKPHALYSKFDHFVKLLGGENKILHWQALGIIANLASIDSRGKVDKILDAYFDPIGGPVMITAANVINGASAIAQAKPHLTKTVVNELLRVEKAKYKTAECRKIALGHAIEALDSIFPQIQDPKPVLKMVRKQLRSTRPATKRKAERFLKKHAG